MVQHGISGTVIEWPRDFSKILLNVDCKRWERTSAGVQPLASGPLMQMGQPSGEGQAGCGHCNSSGEINLLLVPTTKARERCAESGLCAWASIRPRLLHLTRSPMYVPLFAPSPHSQLALIQIIEPYAHQYRWLPSFEGSGNIYTPFSGMKGLHGSKWYWEQTSLSGNGSEIICKPLLANSSSNETHSFLQARTNLLVLKTSKPNGILETRSNN